MISTRLLLLGATALTTFLLGGCATSSTMNRIDQNRALYESWPLDVQQAILDKRIIADMTPEQVEMVLGKPSSVSSRMTSKGVEEVWIYKSGGGILNSGNTNVSLGGSIGGVGVYGNPGSTNAPATNEENEVVFVDGRVVRSTFGP